jgi:hypothetical protein
MLTLTRFTTEFCSTQDRIRLTGEGEADDRVQVWLTRRLLDRLLPVVIDWLPQAEGGGGSGPMASLVSEFQQQAAVSGVVPQPPVRATPTTRDWLAEAIDVNRAADQLGVVLKAAGQVPVGLTFTPVSLRQWLGILCVAYFQADWPVAVWPEWIRSSVTQKPSVSPGLLH